MIVWQISTQPPSVGVPRTSTYDALRASLQRDASLQVGSKALSFNLVFWGLFVADRLLGLNPFIPLSKSPKSVGQSYCVNPHPPLSRDPNPSSPMPRQALRCLCDLQLTFWPILLVCVCVCVCVQGGLNMQAPHVSLSSRSRPAAPRSQLVPARLAASNPTTSLEREPIAKRKKGIE